MHMSSDAYGGQRYHILLEIELEIFIGHFLSLLGLELNPLQKWYAFFTTGPPLQDIAHFPIVLFFLIPKLQTSFGVKYQLWLSAESSQALLVVKTEFTESQAHFFKAFG